MRILRDLLSQHRAEHDATPAPIVILGFMREWDPKQGLGNLISATLPYAVGVFIAQTGLFLVFYAAGLPIGPGVGFHLE